MGIGRKTGYRWRAENGGLPPGRLAEDVRAGRGTCHCWERQRIATLHRQGLGVRAIAARLGRSPSTVSRELRRNTRPHDRGTYDGDLAHARARERARRRRRGRLLADAGLRAEVQAKLELEWSPEQIAAHLRRAYGDRPSWHVCHETIYQAQSQDHRCVIGGPVATSPSCMRGIARGLQQWPVQVTRVSHFLSNTDTKN